METLVVDQAYLEISLLNVNLVLSFTQIHSKKYSQKQILFLGIMPWRQRE